MAVSNSSVNSKKINFLIIFAALIFIIFPVDFLAQKKRVRLKIPFKSGKKTNFPKPTTGRIISGGVLNGKALNLVTPEFPAAARKFGLHGMVTVQVLIDEQSSVIDAKAVRGHPLLIPNSVKAAKSSKFEPFQLGNSTFYKVSGVILYHYIAERLNWLELGYAFTSQTSLYSNRLENYLPSGFEEERQLLTQGQSPETRLTVSASIENKLSSNDKNFWLFSVGKEIGELSNKDPETAAGNLDNIQILLYSAPDKISPHLKKFLENLLAASKTDVGQFGQTLQNSVDGFFLLGN